MNYWDHIKQMPEEVQDEACYHAFIAFLHDTQPDHAEIFEDMTPNQQRVVAIFWANSWLMGRSLKPDRSRALRRRLLGIPT